MQRKHVEQQPLLLKIREDIDVSISGIDCIIKTAYKPKSSQKWDDDKVHYVMFFHSGNHYEWVLIDDEYYEKIKKYIK